MINLALFNTEIYFLITAAGFLVLSLLPKANAQRDYITAMTLSAIGMGMAFAGINQQGDMFAQVYRIDLFSQVFKVLLSIGLFLIICVCSELKSIPERLHPEFYFLLTIATLAMMIMVSSVHLLTVYISLELSSYSLYILVYLRTEHKLSLTATLRYFIIGATASAVMLFGMAVLYSFVGSAYLVDIFKNLPAIIDRPMVVIGFFFTLAGFFFKLAVFPFHFWVPETYHGASNQVAAYIATASKVAAIALLIRIIALSGGNSEYPAKVLIYLSIISMTVGNLSAIVQKDLKKLLAYSSIAHAGYALIGILSMNQAGYTGAVFYALALLILKFTCFFVVIKAAANGQNPTMDHLAGLHQRSPILALALLLALFGLAGIPPTVGFTGKLLVFTAAIEKGYFALVLIAMINVVISLYYYLLVLKAAYLTEPDKQLPELSTTMPVKILASAMITAIVAAGFFPAYLIRIAEAATAILI
jgi:NADH-quinone oxidoreductase subunit N